MAGDCKIPGLSKNLRVENGTVAMHTKACLAKRLIRSIETWRDDSSITDFDFRIAAQDNQWLQEADDLENYSTCTCNMEGT